MGIIFKQGPVTVLKQFEDGSEEIAISTDAKDRMGDVIEQDGWELGNYQANPVVLFAHDYRSVPIARTLALRLEEHALVAHFAFRDPANDADPVHFVRSAWEQGVLRAASVGFNPLASEPMPAAEDDEEDGDFFFPPTHYLRQELLEWSIVPVPANQEALRRALDDYLTTFGLELPRPVSAPRGGSSDPANASHPEILAALSSYLDALKGRYTRTTP